MIWFKELPWIWTWILPVWNHKLLSALKGTPNFRSSRHDNVVFFHVAGVYNPMVVGLHQIHPIQPQTMDKRAKEQMTVVEQAINKERLDRAKKPETLQLQLDQDDGMMMGWWDEALLKASFQWPMLCGRRVQGEENPWFFTGFRFWRVDGLSRTEVSPSLNLRLAQNKLRPGCRYGALKGWFPLGPWQSLIDHLWRWVTVFF